MSFEDLTPELQEKVRACKSAEELLALAKAEGRDLTEEELDQVSGGGGWETYGQCNGDNHNGPFTYVLTAWDGDKLYRCECCEKQIYESKLRAAGINP